MHIHTDNTPPGPRAAAPRSDIAGWGADLAEVDRPAYPKERTPPRLDVPWRVPAEQQVTVEVLHSNERPGLTPVFGTTLPPRGLSGVLRRLAFRASENDLRHWLILMLADRIDVVEGVAEDLMHGHIPNVFAEAGARAAWRHDPQGVVRKVATVTVVAVVAIGLVALLRKSRHDK